MEKYRHKTNRKLKCFFVSQVFYPDEAATPSLFTDLMVKIAENTQIDMEVWCAQPSYTTKKRQKGRVEYKNISICYVPVANFSNDIRLL